MNRALDERPVRVVVKEHRAPQWMKSLMPNDTSQHQDYVNMLGLDDVHKEWNIAFGVDYS